jgi:hypothetical protein
MKQTILTKEFQGMLGELKQLDDDLGISIDLKNTKRDEKEIKTERRRNLLKEIWSSWPRRTVLDKEILQMRGNALKNPEVRTILEKTNIRIEDCALVNFSSDQYMGEIWDCPGDCSPESIRKALLKYGWANSWRPFHRYLWGSPKDRIKILFEQSANNRFKVIGLIEIFPEKKAA